MTTAQQAALDKIKKLLRMRRGGTKGEIENALAAAARIARQHGIDLDTVNPDDEQYDRPIGHASVPYGTRVPPEMEYATSIVINFFNVMVCIVEKASLWHGVRSTFVASYIGTEWDIAVARHVFHFLVSHFRRSWRERENRRLRRRLAYFHGMFIGISTKLRKELPKPTPQSPGLIHLERNLARLKAKMAELHPSAQDHDLPEDDTDADAARTAGYFAGLTTEIFRNLKGKNAPDPIGNRLLAMGDSQ